MKARPTATASGAASTALASDLVQLEVTALMQADDDDRERGACASSPAVVRVFAMATPAGGAVEQQLAKVVELPMPPARGQHVRLADGEDAHPIDRVIVTARPSGAHWTPGWLAANLVTVMLQPEPSDGLAAAFANDWKDAGT